MNIIWMKRCLEAGVIGGGLWLLGTGLASAQALDHGPSDPVQGVLSAPVTAPITVGGNAISVLGGGQASSGKLTTGSSGSASSSAHPRSLVSVPVTAPIAVCGNAVGRASAGCTVAGPTGSTGSGTVADVPITAPITVCGNAAGLLGTSSASCTGSGSGSPSGGSASGGSTGIAVPVTAPVTACGNAVGLLGSATAGCSGGTQTPVGSSPGAGGGSAAGGSSIIGATGHAVDGTSAERGLVALRSSERPDLLAFTGSSLAVLEWLALALLTAGSVLSRGGRRQAC